MGKLLKTVLTFLLWSMTLPVFAQITVTIENKTLIEAIEILESETDYSFFYSNQLPGLNVKVSVKAVELSINQLLDKLLAGTGVSYSIKEGKQVTLF